MTVGLVSESSQRVSRVARAHGWTGSSTDSLAEFIENKLEELAALRNLLAPQRGHASNWRDAGPTIKQVQYLMHLGYEGRVPTTKGEAHDIIQRLVEDGEPHPTHIVRAMRLRP